MIQRHDLVVFTSHDSDAGIYPIDSGGWVSYEDYIEMRDLAIDGLKNLRSSNMQNVPAGQYNNYVDNLIEALK